MRDRLIGEVLSTIPDSHLNGHPTERLPNNAHFRFEGIEGESLLLSLKDEGIAVSTGSACSSKTLEPSHTLISCGLLHEEAHGSLEFTFGRFSQDQRRRPRHGGPARRSSRGCGACRPLYETD